MAENLFQKQSEWSTYTLMQTLLKQRVITKREANVFSLTCCVNGLKWTRAIMTNTLLINCKTSSRGQECTLVSLKLSIYKWQISLNDSPEENSDLITVEKEHMLDIWVNFEINFYVLFYKIAKFLQVHIFRTKREYEMVLCWPYSKSLMKP